MKSSVELKEEKISQIELHNNAEIREIHEEQKKEQEKVKGYNDMDKDISQEKSDTNEKKQKDKDKFQKKSDETLEKKEKKKKKKKKKKKQDSNEFLIEGITLPHIGEIESDVSIEVNLNCFLVKF